MRDGEKRIGLALLLLLLGACSDAGGSIDGRASFDDDDDSQDEDATSEEVSPVEGAKNDGGRRDAGPRDAATKDAGANVEARDASRPDAAAAPADASTARDAAPPPSNDPGIPEGDHCAATADWDPASTAFEDEVLRLTNEARATGHNCGSEGNFPATGPLTMEPQLRCAARLYSKLMGETGKLSHTGPDGSTVGDRIKAAGYQARRAYGENIAWNQQTPAEVVRGWLDSDGHCRNIMSASFKEIGVGFFATPGSFGRRETWWTQNFGAR